MICFSDAIGAPWRHEMGHPAAHLNALCSRGNSLVAVGEFGTLMSSSDAGATWVLHRAKISEALLAIACDSAGNLFALGADGRVFRGDLDRGWSLLPELSSRVALVAIAVTADDSLIGVGPPGQIFLRKDNAPWTEHSVKKPVALNAVWVSPRGRCVVVGEKGTVLVSDDNARTFEVRKSGTTAKLLAVAGNARGLVVAVGARGTVIRSSDGGNTWERVAVDTRGDLACVWVGDHVVAMGGDDVEALVSTDDARTLTKTRGGTYQWPKHKLHGATGISRNGVEQPWFVGRQGLVLSVDPASAVFSKELSGGGTDSLSLYRLDDGALIATMISGYVLRSEDDGYSWQIEQPGYFLRSVGGSRDGQTLVTGQFVSGVHLSFDAGRTWCTENTGVKDRGNFDYLNDHQVRASGEIMAVGADLLLRRNTDGFWQATSLREVDGVSLIETASNHLLVAGKRGEVLRSVDGGVSFDLLTGPTFNDWIRLFSLPSRDGFLAMKMGGQRYLWKDDSQGWRETVFPHQGTMRDWHVLSENEWVVAQSNGLQLTTDGGASWTSFSCAETDLWVKNRPSLQMLCRSRSGEILGASRDG